jgi:serine/threonine-protein kinase
MQALSDRYRILRVLGEGGMATVYLARDLKHKRNVAIKVMRPELAATLGADRFLREVEIAGHLNHPHILPLYDSGAADGLLYYVMPHVEGETLRDRLQKQGALPVDEALQLAREVAEALAYAHRRGIVHRDIKPANIMLGEGHALVADFGIARALGDGGAESLTRTGLAVGTPRYMAPEQAMGEREVDGRADVYATGAMLYEMLAGEPPFSGPNARAILARTLTEKPRALSSVRSGLPPGLEATLDRALARNPADRFATAEQMVLAIDAVRREGSPSAAIATATPEAAERPGGAAPLASPPRGGPTLRHALMGGAAALAVLAAAAAVITARRPAAAPGRVTNRVAVLPFVNQGAQRDDYFAEGIADEVRGKLARINGLAIIASATAARYKGSSKEPQTIAQELDADYLLLGRVRWAGSGDTRRVQVVPELIDARTGEVTWQESFDTHLTDVFEVQSQIASRVAGALGVALGGTVQQQLSLRPTTSGEAYQLYLKARGIAAIDPASQRSSADLLEQAVALDSAFADAWAALSAAQSRVYGGEGTASAARRAREALAKARQLAPEAAATHVAAARFQLAVERNPQAAQVEMDLALRVAPNDANVLTAASQFDRNNGDLVPALAKLERAREIDPRSYGTLAGLSRLYLNMGRPADAEAAAESMAQLRPTELEVVHWRAIILTARGKPDEARAAIREAMAAGVPAPSLAAHFAGFQEVSWILDEPERQLVGRLTPSAFENDLAFWGQSLATAYWQLGDSARARAYADSALAESSAQAKAVPDDPQRAGLHGLMLAYLGRGPAARSEMRRMPAVHPNTEEGRYVLLLVLRVELALGDDERALDSLERMRTLGVFYARPEWLRADPTFRSLEGHPRFDALLKT